MAAVVALAASCCGSKAPKVLVLYYSQTGNTQAVAEEIAAKLGAESEAIAPVVAYDGDFQATIERSRQELESGTLPEIKPLSHKVADYDIIFLGYPVWFGTYAPPVSAFLEGVDLSGKKVVPFCTFGSGGLDSSSRDLQEKFPDAEILPGYGVRAARMAALPAEVDRFLKEYGFIEGEFEKPGEFSESHPASEEEAAIFDAAVDGYPMLNAKAKEVCSRTVPGGIEYLFVAESLPGEAPSTFPVHDIKVYVLAEEGQAPVFTQVIR